jgi:hypothetical protein
LTLNQAATAVGVRLRRAREVAATELFQTELNRAVKALRNSERARNLQTAIAIRDDNGDGTAATKTVRLKAIAAIEGREKHWHDGECPGEQPDKRRRYIPRLRDPPRWP